MGKFKSWLRNKLKSFLEIDIIEKDVNGLSNMNKLEHDRMMNIFKHNEDLIKKFLATCDVGYDLGVNNYHKNWCVFARQGTGRNGNKIGQDFVKFIDLSDMKLEDINHFERELERLSNYSKDRHPRFDAPMGIKDYFVFNR